MVFGMELLKLKYFQMVAKQQHLTKAAHELNISQPALSKMIAKLEKDLGYKLFNRKGRELQLSRLGEAYLRTVDKVFMELDAGERELALLSEKQNQLISVAITIPSILPELFGGFLEKHPMVQFRQYQAYSDRTKKQIETGEVDVGITTFPVSGDEIEWLPILEEELWLSVPLNHPLANRGSIYLHEVKDDPFIVTPPGYGFRDMTEQLCMQAGFYPNYSFEGNETGITQELVEAGLGVAFFPSLLTSKRVSNLKTVKLKIIEPRCVRTVGLVRHKYRVSSEFVNDFIQYTIHFFEQKKEK
jgi:DNA-binding transcriptional LysR family regulator